MNVSNTALVPSSYSKIVHVSLKPCIPSLAICFRSTISAGYMHSVICMFKSRIRVDGVVHFLFSNNVHFMRFRTF